jgi:hypothetical protein
VRGARCVVGCMAPGDEAAAAWPHRWAALTTDRSDVVCTDINTGREPASGRCAPSAPGWHYGYAPASWAGVTKAEEAGAAGDPLITLVVCAGGRSSMGLICGNPPPSPAGMRIPTRRLQLQRATFQKARSDPATPRERRSRSRQFPRGKSAVPVAPPPGCPSIGSTGRSLLQTCSKPHKNDQCQSIGWRASSPARAQGSPHTGPPSRAARQTSSVT